VFERAVFLKKPLKRREELPVCATQAAMRLIALLKRGNKTKNCMPMHGENWLKAHKIWAITYIARNNGAQPTA
jgi:hypothetical protein